LSKSLKRRKGSFIK